MDKNAVIQVERIEHSIYLIRGQKVMLDADLAELYEVETKILNKAVKRHLDRFPEDFMFQLTTEETENLRFQIGTSRVGHGGRRYLPYAFTEQGVAMLSGLLSSPTDMSNSQIKGAPNFKHRLMRDKMHINIDVD